mmetsp:Transcript_64304/g.106375  ORF Transcript_64304/g.106375 Transcript_64304/m.106375 type:complete len:440 (-) Transcript_64304:683-2002(-)
MSLCQLSFVLGSDLPSSDHDAAFIGIWRQCVILRLTHVTLLVNRIKQNVDGFARRLDLSLRPSQLALCRNSLFASLGNIDLTSVALIANPLDILPFGPDQIGQHGFAISVHGHFHFLFHDVGVCCLCGHARLLRNLQGGSDHVNSVFHLGRRPKDGDLVVRKPTPIVRHVHKSVATLDPKLFNGLALRSNDHSNHGVPVPRLRDGDLSFDHSNVSENGSLCKQAPLLIAIQAEAVVAIKRDLDIVLLRNVLDLLLGLCGPCILRQRNVDKRQLSHIHNLQWLGWGLLQGSRCCSRFGSRRRMSLIALLHSLQPRGNACLGVAGGLGGNYAPTAGAGRGLALLLHVWVLSNFRQQFEDNPGSLLCCFQRTAKAVLIGIALGRRNNQLCPCLLPDAPCVAPSLANQHPMHGSAAVILRDLPHHFDLLCCNLNLAGINLSPS